ncbi:MAG: cob(I)yrinic acid a,c-diamide adenosyltransferase [Anaerolineae bacterium]
MKIYTRSGDSGETGLFGGGRVPKHDPRVEAYGTVDELNSWLGVVCAEPIPEQAQRWLIHIQNDLFFLGADLATPLEADAANIVRVDSQAVEALEAIIDQIDAELPPLKNFILPGGSRAAALLHVARTVCRRAERTVVALAERDTINQVSLVYLNRLADLLFVLARWLNLQAGIEEQRWHVNRNG